MPRVEVVLHRREGRYDSRRAADPAQPPAGHVEALRHAVELDGHVPAELRDRFKDKANRVRGLASLKFLWEDFLVPLARSMMAGVEAAAASFRPHVMVVDQQALAGALVAQRHGLPWATFVTTSAGVTDPLAGLPKVRAWVDEQLERLQAEAGLPGHGRALMACLVVQLWDEVFLQGD